MNGKLSGTRLIIVSSVVCMLLTLGWAVKPGLTASADLPPRPTPPPPQVKTVVKLDGGKIMLQTLFDESWPSTGMDWQDLYTVVQWQDEWDDWHNVDGWRGTLDRVYTVDGQVKGAKTWWVPEKLFGSDMFRWQVYSSQNGDLLAQSEVFGLPVRIGQSVIVEVQLNP